MLQNVLPRIAVKTSVLLVRNKHMIQVLRLPIFLEILNIFMHAVVRGYVKSVLCIDGLSFVLTLTLIFVAGWQASTIYQGNLSRVLLVGVVFWFCSLLLSGVLMRSLEVIFGFAKPVEAMSVFIGQLVSFFLFLPPVLVIPAVACFIQKRKAGIT